MGEAGLPYYIWLLLVAAYALAHMLILHLRPNYYTSSPLLPLSPFHIDMSSPTYHSHPFSSPSGLSPSYSPPHLSVAQLSAATK